MTIRTLSVEIQSICIACSIIVVHEIVSIKIHIWAKDVIEGVRGASPSSAAVDRVFGSICERLPGIARCLSERIMDEWCWMEGVFKETSVPRRDKVLVDEEFTIRGCERKYVFMRMPYNVNDAKIVITKGSLASMMVAGLANIPCYNFLCLGLPK